MSTERSIHVARTIAASLWLTAAFSLALLPDIAIGAEACGSNGSPFELLDPGDDDSGIGGTGRGETRPPSQPAPRAQRAGDDDDSGIGGTGRSPRPAGDDDSGIGGTGIFGTVTRTDRLCVNGLEIGLPPQLAIEAATGDAAERGLAVGQVVLLRVDAGDEGLIASQIRLYPGLAGRIELLAGDGQWMRVAGRRVVVPGGLSRDAPSGVVLDERFGDALPVAGDFVVVHGLPDAEGRLVASRIEPGAAGHTLLPDAALAGWPALLRRFEYLSVEGYVAGDRDALRVAGLQLTLLDELASIPHQPVRAGARIRVDGRVAPGGVLSVERPPGWTRPLRPSGSERVPGGGERDGASSDEGTRTNASGRPASAPAPDASPRPNAAAKPSPDRRTPTSRDEPGGGARPPRRPDVRPPERPPDRPAPRPSVDRPQPARPTRLELDRR